MARKPGTQRSATQDSAAQNSGARNSSARGQDKKPNQAKTPSAKAGAERASGGRGQSAHDGSNGSPAAETGKRLRMATRRDTMERYRAFFEEHCANVRGELAKYGARYLRLSSEQSLEEVLFTRLPKEGVLR